MRYSKLISKIAIGALAGLMFTATAANATSYLITDVINATQNGFTSTVFHTAVSNGGTGGSIIETAKDGLAANTTGTYDDVSGVINYSFDLISGKNVSGVGNIDFSVGADASLGKITTTFSSNVLGKTVFEIEYFQHTYAGFANSFDNVLPDLFLTLWGAEGTPTSGGLFDTHTTTIGSDLRFALVLDPNQITVVPVPAALPLFGTGLAIMGFVGWRRKRKTAA